MIKKIILSIYIISFINCKQNSETKRVITKNHIDIDVERFDQNFLQLNTSTYNDLKNKYPYFFNNTLNDQEWIERSHDSLHIDISKEVSTKFPNTKKLNKEISELLEHITYYFPKTPTPKVISLISSVDYHNRVILSGDLLLLSLDCYLGQSHKYYKDIQHFISSDFEPKLLKVDIAMEYAKKIIKQPNTRNFIDYMIMYGKRYYFISKVLPNLNTPQHLSYTDSEYNWAETNEAFIWRYFIEKELLYKTDKNLLTRFIYPAPFSKFYLETDRQTTAEIGKYIGYKIVKSFIENNDTNLNELITLDANTIFKRSKYKPKK